MFYLINPRHPLHNLVRGERLVFEGFFDGVIYTYIYKKICKDYTHNFKPQEIKMTNKVLRKKSNCVVCRSSNSRFLKQKITIKTKNNLATT